MRAYLLTLKQYLLSGVSYVIPFVACAGILIAAAIALAPIGADGPNFSGHPILQIIINIGGSAMGLVVPVLAGFIAFGMVDRPGLVPGFVGGWIATHLGTKIVGTQVIEGLVDGKTVQVTVPKTMELSAGFLGGIAAGLLAGFAVMLLKKLPAPKLIRPIMPILIIPVLATLAVGSLMYCVLGTPISDLMTWLGEALKSMSGGSQVFLAMILGAMIAFDMGGPVNKAAFFFGVAMIAEKNYAVMGACAAAICIPPLGLGLATMLGRFFKGSNWSERERDTGIAALAMGSIGITEGAIPFAAGDPLRVIPTIMLGSMVGAVIAMLGGSGDHAPHGGLIVLPVVDGKLNYILAVAAGALTVAVSINLLRAFTGAKDEE
jgi:PTS system fructose-specific IIC component/fructose-specific PTS system IIC-like component